MTTSALLAVTHRRGILGDQQRGGSCDESFELSGFLMKELGWLRSAGAYERRAVLAPAGQEVLVAAVAARRAFNGLSDGEATAWRQRTPHNFVLMEMPRRRSTAIAAEKRGEARPSRCDRPGLAARLTVTNGRGSMSLGGERA